MCTCAFLGASIGSQTGSSTSLRTYTGTDTNTGTETQRHTHKQLTSVHHHGICEVKVLMDHISECVAVKLQEQQPGGVMFTKRKGKMCMQKLRHPSTQRHRHTAQHRHRHTDTQHMHIRRHRHRRTLPFVATESKKLRSRCTSSPLTNCAESKGGR